VVFVVLFDVFFSVCQPGVLAFVAFLALGLLALVALGFL